MATFRWSGHARKRAAEMDVPEDEIELVLAEPSHTYPNCLGHPSGKTYVCGRLAVPVAEDNTILTVLWNGRCGRSASPADHEVDQ